MDLEILSVIFLCLVIWQSYQQNSATSPGQVARKTLKLSLQEAAQGFL
jgi:hypothetical protein